MQRLLAQPQPGVPAQAAVLAVDWRTYLTQGLRGGRNALLDELATGSVSEPNRSAPNVDVQPGQADVRARIAAAPAARQRGVLATFVRERALAVLGLDSARAIDPAMPLGDLGLDSLLAVELRNLLSTALALRLPATLLFDYPTIDALTGHLFAEISRELSTSRSAIELPIVTSDSRATSTIVDSIAELSDEEVERQLAARSKRIVRT